MVTLKEMEKRLRKNPKYRKAEYDLQYDSNFNSSRVISSLILQSGMTRSQIIRKAKTTQSGLSRAENRGCSLTYLNKIAKATGKALEIKIVGSLPNTQ